MKNVETGKKSHENKKQIILENNSEVFLNSFQKSWTESIGVKYEDSMIFRMDIWEVNI